MAFFRCTGGNSGGGGGGNSSLIFYIDRQRGTTGNSLIQLTELQFYDENQNQLTFTATASTTASSVQTSETCEHVIDGDLTTKWCFTKQETNTLILNFSGDFKPAYYSFITGNDSDSRDPISFGMIYCKGGQTQYINHQTSSDSNVPTARLTETPLYACTYT